MVTQASFSCFLLDNDLGGLVLPKSSIKTFVTRGLNERTIFRPQLVDYLFLVLIMPSDWSLDPTV